MTEKNVKQWTYRQTEQRREMMEDLRRRLDTVYPGKGERQNGVITTAQILDWALEDLRLKLIDMEID